MAESGKGAEPNVRVYRVEAFGYIFALFLILFTLVGVIQVIPLALRRGPEDPPVAFFVAWLAVLGWFWFNVLRSPYEVRVTPDGLVSFRRLIGAVTLPASHIHRIQGLAMRGGMVVHHSSGRVWLRALMRDSFDFLSELKRLNPTIEIRGI